MLLIWENPEEICAGHCFFILGKQYVFLDCNHTPARGHAELLEASLLPGHPHLLRPPGPGGKCCAGLPPPTPTGLFPFGQPAPHSNDGHLSGMCWGCWPIGALQVGPPLGTAERPPGVVHPGHELPNCVLLEEACPAGQVWCVSL